MLSKKTSTVTDEVIEVMPGQLMFSEASGSIVETQSNVQTENSEVLPLNARPIALITEEVAQLKGQMGIAIFKLGQRLIEAKTQLEHGQWRIWLQNEAGIPEREAQRFMRIAKEYTNPTALSDLGMTKALTLLALPSDTRTIFIAESHNVGGERKTVSGMSTRELEKTVRDYKEALNSKEAAMKRANEQKQETLIEDFNGLEAAVDNLLEKLSALDAGTDAELLRKFSADFETICRKAMAKLSQLEIQLE